MTLDKSEMKALVNDKLIPKWRNELEKLDRIDGWYRWDPEELVPTPRQATRELKALRELAKVPWLGLVVTSTAQCLFVDGFRSVLDPVTDPDQVVLPPLQPGQAPPPPVADKPKPPEGPWRIWLANGMDKRQGAIHRASLAYGYAYATVLPGKDFTGAEMPIIRGISPRKMIAVYEDAAADDWPKYAMQVVSRNKDMNDYELRLFDEENVYDVIVRGGPTEAGRPAFEITRTAAHGSSVCPVVRYCNQLDLDGRTPGEVEPHIPIAARINKTAYDRLLAQHFNSWKIRWIAGLSSPDAADKAIAEKLKLAQSDFLVFEDQDTKTGSLPETTLTGFIQANGADIEHLAAVSQTPTHELTGQLVNLSAEALAAARASQTQKIHERQLSFGSGHVQALRLASALDGDEEHATDITARMTWQDTSIRSMAQAVDALGKAATMLHVPAEALWSRIPGVEQNEVDEWVRMARQVDPIQLMMQQMTGSGPGGAPSPGGIPGHDPASRVDNGKAIGA